MKIFHTADWHLGKQVHGAPMTEDQRYVLQQFIADVRKEKPDALIVAGDLYDRSIPPTEAIHLLNDTFKQIIFDEKVPVLAIAGNHDSATRIHFASDLLKMSGLHITGHLTTTFEPVVLFDAHGPVHFYLIPFAEPSIVRALFEDDAITTHESAMEKIIESIQATMDKTVRNVFIGHAFITKNGEPEPNTSDSERKLTVGGTECIDSHLFEPFCYTALGHLHEAHYVRNETIRYAGSPLKYSESEINHKKGYLIVDLQADGTVQVEKRQLRPVRDMRIVKGTLEEILQHERSEDYVFVKLTDENYVKAAIEQVRTVYPNALHIERTAIFAAIENEATTIERVSMDDAELFELFYKEMTGIEADAATKEIFEDVLEQLLASKRESQEVL